MTNKCRVCRRVIDARTLKAGGEVCFDCATSPAEPMLRVGDTVLWRGGFGGEEPRRAVVEGLERTKRPHEKYGDEVKEIPWRKVAYCVVSLDNGHWAYGDQLAPLDGRA